ncbi:MAG: hypothetical protein ACQESR_07260 [Planctomycetota bacterium]
MSKLPIFDTSRETARDSSGDASVRGRGVASGSHQQGRRSDRVFCSPEVHAPSSESSRLDVLLIGDANHHEFRDAVDWLRKRTNLSLAKTVDQAIKQSEEGGEHWHTVFFAQSRPGQLSVGDVERMTRSFPLAHYVALLGSLCEGESRSSMAWPGMARIYWHQFPTRVFSELRRSAHPTSWQLPRTASDLERTAAMLATLPSQASGLIVVFTRDAFLFEALSAACGKIGHATTWCWNDRCLGVHGATAAIWDGTFQGQVDFEQLSRITTDLADVPVIALLAFPRHDHLRQARESGARAVIPTPFMLPDLWNVLRELS